MGGLLISVLGCKMKEDTTADVSPLFFLILFPRINRVSSLFLEALSSEESAVILSKDGIYYLWLRLNGSISCSTDPE